VNHVPYPFLVLSPFTGKIASMGDPWVCSDALILVLPRTLFSIHLIRRSFCPTRSVRRSACPIRPIRRSVCPIWSVWLIRSVRRSVWPIRSDDRSTRSDSSLRRTVYPLHPLHSIEPLDREVVCASVRSSYTRRAAPPFRPTTSGYVETLLRMFCVVLMMYQMIVRWLWDDFKGLGRPPLYRGRMDASRSITSLPGTLPKGHIRSLHPLVMQPFVGTRSTLHLLAETPLHSWATIVNQLECQMTGPPSWVSTRSAHRAQSSCRSAHLAELASLPAGLAHLAELASSFSLASSPSWFSLNFLVLLTKYFGPFLEHDLVFSW